MNGLVFLRVSGGAQVPIGVAANELELVELLEHIADVFRRDPAEAHALFASRRSSTESAHGGISAGLLNPFVTP